VSSLSIEGYIDRVGALANRLDGLIALVQVPSNEGGVEPKLSVGEKLRTGTDIKSDIPNRATARTGTPLQSSSPS
jgi:hypothetical protein